MIFKKQYIVPSVRTERLEPLSPLASSDQDWQVGGDDVVGGQGAKNNYFDDEETDDFSSSYFK